MNKLSAKKELGQNFLVDMDVADAMVAALDICADDVILEIGPGLGVLTQRLVKVSKNDVYAVEFDPRMVTHLEKAFTKNAKLKIIYANILDWLKDVPTDFKQTISGKKLKILGSLPYYITSPILHAVIYSQVQPVTAVFMVQKEVAEKIVARAPDSSYLSSFVQTFYAVEYLGSVYKEAFDPVPKVDGGIIKLTKKELAESINIPKYEKFLHHVYSSPRKMLNKVFKPEELEKAKIDGSLRAQNFDANDWLEIFQKTI